MFFFITLRPSPTFFFFFFNDTATTEIYTLSLHDALPICAARSCRASKPLADHRGKSENFAGSIRMEARSRCRILYAANQHDLDVHKNREGIAGPRNGGGDYPARPPRLLLGRFSREQTKRLLIN